MGFEERAEFDEARAESLTGGGILICGLEIQRKFRVGVAFLFCL